MIHSNKKSHVIGLKSPSKVSLVRSKSTDQLTSTHKSIGRKHPVQKTIGNDVSMTKIVGQNKSKSVKSLKVKTKSTPKAVQTKSTKKIKPKQKKNSQSDCKTIKKPKNLVKVIQSEQSFNSESTTKPQALQYFFYQNTYIPIQNSAQRRFVFKIREVDKLVQQTSDTFFKRTYESCQLPRDQHEEKSIVQVKNQSQDNWAQTEKAVIMQFGTNTTPRNQQQISIQTQTQKFEQDVKKCFSTTLNDLQFLFLPDQNNFQGFSKAQRLHYKELFESIAVKIWTNGQNLQELTQDKVQVLLYQRQCIQMGMLQFYPQQGFPTHIFAVMSYLTNLFSYAEMKEKNEALEKIHSIYGFSYQERFSRLIRGYPTKKRCSPILSEQLFLSLQKQLFKDHDFGSELVQKSVHIHNKAIFDAANEQLEKFKPFYYSKGEPFPWSINVGMTFFSIDESTLPLLFKQIKQKILMKFGYLCGLLIDYDEFKQTPNKEKHPVHIKKLQHHEHKMINDEAIDEKNQAQIQQADASLKAQLGNFVLQTLINELCLEMVQKQP